MNTNPAINWDQLAIVVGDENDPGDEEMKDLYRLFVDDAGQRLRKLCAPQVEFDRTGVAKEAHKVRGAASSFGFDQVSDILRTVELQISELHQDRIEELLRQALVVFQASVNGVAQRFPALAA